MSLPLTGHLKTVTPKIIARVLSSTEMKNSALHSASRPTYDCFCVYRKLNKIVYYDKQILFVRSIFVF